MKVIPEMCCVCKFDIYVLTFIKTVKLPKYQFKTYFTVKCELAENSYKKNVKFPVFHAKSTEPCNDQARPVGYRIIISLHTISHIFDKLLC